MFKLIPVIILTIILNLPALAILQNPQEIQIVNVSDRTFGRDLNRLENMYFKSNYNNETNTQRLDRLEYRAYGAKQAGSDEERLSKLKKTALAYKSLQAVDFGNDYYNAPYYEAPVYSNGTGWKRFLGNFGTYFTGVPTGFTPPIYGNNGLYNNNGFYNNSYYNNNSPDLYDGGNTDYYRTNRGYRYNNSNGGTHSSVTLID